MDAQNKAASDSETSRPLLVISSEEEFRALVEDVDHEMIAEGVGIPARPIVAGCKITGRYDIVLDAFPPAGPILPGVFTPEQISKRIHDWMKKRYGDRLKVPFQIGRVAIPLRGSLYTIRCPVMFGRVRFVCEPGTFGQSRKTIGVRSVPTCNVVDLINGFTADLARSLTAEEVVKIGLAHALAMSAYVALHAVSDVQFVNEVQGDLDAAVSHLVEHKSQPGLSKWASLQAVEKILKAYIVTKDKTIDVKKIGHKLEELAATAVKMGLPAIPNGYISDVQCPAGVRYGEIAVSVEEAGIAHLISLEVCEVAAQSIGIALNRKVPKNPQPLIDGIPAEDFLKRHAVTR
ncbi:MAG TPA: hypothetical protein VHX86_10520 [Tepidisphaeraceae bacterium]|jgi:hypothetical protein|nr:hypothetical protein [Tepidisphaeraceae bacterium]